MNCLTSFARCAPSAAILADIRHEDCNLAIWERTPIDGITQLLPDAARDIRFKSTVDAVAQHLPEQITKAGYPASPLWEGLVQDVGILAGLYCATLQRSSFMLRLELVTTDACRKFHADYVTARLITTYAGRGTQWLEEEAIEQLARDQEPQRTKSLQPGDVGLFKGRLATVRPAIHRSPPISGAGEKRLLLVLNPVEE